MKKVIFGALVAMVLAACVKDDVSIAKVEEAKNPYAVTPDEAVQLLKTVIGGESTRAVSVGEIKTLRKSDFVPTTRGGEDGDVIYIVDLEDGGSAVMGADKRMEPIYAILDETKISPEELALTATRSDDGEQDIEEYVVGLLNDKIQADASTFAFPEMPITPRPRTITLTIPIFTKEPFLRTKWGAGTPYSNLFTGTNFLSCGPIALSQLMYYNRFPSNIGSYYFNWSQIAEFEINGNCSSSAEPEVARFVYEVANSMVSSNTTMYSTLGLIQSLNHVGYSNVQQRNYHYLYVLNMLEKNMPCLVSGRDPIREGHAWLIDGCNIFSVETYERVYDLSNPRVFTDTLISISETRLMHCNFGWYGDADGYYNSGIFDTTELLENEYIDTSVGDVQQYGAGCYTADLLVTTYDK